MKNELAAPSGTMLVGGLGCRLSVLVRVERRFSAASIALFVIVIPSITTPGLSRHTFPWTPGAPLRLPRRFFSFTRSIVAALYFRFLPYFGILRWSTSGSTNHLSGNGSQILYFGLPSAYREAGCPLKRTVQLPLPTG